MSNKLQIALWMFAVLIIICTVLAWQMTNLVWPNTNEANIFLREFIYYQCYLIPFFLILVIWGFKEKQVSTGFMLFAVIGGILGLYARFIEPNLLFVKETQIKAGYSLKIALISDMHYGLFSTEWQKQRLVDKLNTLDVDMVLVAGDWTYEPVKHISLIEQLAPFKQLRHPIYSVPGNHDEQMPGPPLAKELKQALIANNIQPIENTIIDLGAVRLVGFDSLRYVKRVLATNQSSAPFLLLMHNPDAMTPLLSKSVALIGLAGHTHGGQVNLPIITKKMLASFTTGQYQRGLYVLKNNHQIFVTSGIGMIGLPLRFAMPPTIDILNFY